MIQYRETPPPKFDVIDNALRILSALRHFEWREDREALAALKAGETAFSLAWPVDMKKAWITQYFGANPSSYYPLLGHDGIDFGLSTGSSVRAGAEKETITDLILQKNSYGRHAWTIDGDGHRYIYGHLHEFRCSKGDVILRGQEFALSGGGLEDPYHGYSTGPHLHWEWRPKGSSVSNGYAGAVNQLPYVTFGDVPPTPAPDAKPFAKVKVKNPNNSSWGLTVRNKPSRWAAAIRDLNPNDEVYLYKIGSTEVWAEINSTVAGHIAAIYGGKPYVAISELVNGATPYAKAIVDNPNSPTFGLNVRSRPTTLWSSIIATLLPEEEVNLIGISSTELWVKIDQFKEEYIAVRYGGKPYVELIEFINQVPE